MRVDPTASCAEIAAALSEGLSGTAPHAAAWILVEHPGPWGAAAPKDLTPDSPAGALVEAAARLGIRVQLIRRTGRETAPRSGAAVFLVHTGPERPWIRAGRLRDPGGIAELDLSALAAGRPPAAGDADPGETFLVCTHSRRDPCCARRGRPVAAALAASFPDRTWETTHLGGHRFAANLACLPHGLLFGRVTPADAAGIAASYRDGEIELASYRGRACWPGPVQAAEAWVRDRDGLRMLDAVTVLDHHENSAGVHVEVLVHAGRYRGRQHLRVQVGSQTPARPLSCGDAEVNPPSYRVVPVDQPDAPRAP